MEKNEGIEEVETKGKVAENEDFTKKNGSLKEESCANPFQEALLMMNNEPLTIKRNKEFVNDRRKTTLIIQTLSKEEITLEHEGIPEKNEEKNEKNEGFARKKQFFNDRRKTHEKL